MTRLSLSKQLARRLRHEITAGRFATAERLPSEAALARAFHVSRMTLREALRTLEEEGLVVRRHGVGSFITRQVVAGIERLESFTETIRRAGRAARDRVLAIHPIALREAAAHALGRPPGSPGVLVESLRYADGAPVIYCEDVLPLDLVGMVQHVQQRRERESLQDYLEQDVGIVLRRAVLALHAVAAPATVARHLGVARGHPILLLQGTAEDTTGRPLYFSTNYVRSDRYVFTVVRR
ncbi:MAG: GntR family transcriptional regulator [Armatimonadota bacterium]|nr:GntR family transcriptional regulator [Armatimonadota bacterium]MDR7534708.1 GntR family transcriptional regulator [Armatimonadota bacterium]MDR7534950.1 GntR family transcriptional regulator [Armatimonadota bacterium]